MSSCDRPRTASGAADEKQTAPPGETTPEPAPAQPTDALGEASDDTADGWFEV